MRFFRAALSGLGMFYDVLLPSRVDRWTREDWRRALASRGASPEAVSARTHVAAAPASGHPDEDSCWCISLEPCPSNCPRRLSPAAPCAAGATDVPGAVSGDAGRDGGLMPASGHPTSAVRPPAAVDDPAAGDLPPSAAGSPGHPLVTGNTPTPVRSANPVQSGAGVGFTGNPWRDAEGQQDWDAYARQVMDDADRKAEAYRVSLLKMAGLDVEAIAEDREFDWERWVIPAIREVLAEHESYYGYTAVGCHGVDGVSHASFDDLHDWREHVAPLIAAHIHQAAAALR